MGSETAEEAPKCDKADNHKRGKAGIYDYYGIRTSIITIIRYGIKSSRKHSSYECSILVFDEKIHKRDMFKTKSLKLMLFTPNIIYDVIFSNLLKT